jgi:hypothetical protein
LPQNKGDQIGRIFAYGAIVCFGQFSMTYRDSANFVASFFKQLCMNLTKNLSGFLLGQFFYKLIWSKLTHNFYRRKKQNRNFVSLCNIQNKECLK